MPRPKLTYRNDSKLKKAGIMMDYTPEQIRELKTCHDDIYHFAEKYFEIVTLDADAYGERRKIIKVRDYQKRILDSVTKSRFTCVLSPRQIGKCLASTTYINLRNKKTGQIVEITLGDFYEWQRFKKWGKKFFSKDL